MEFPTEHNRDGNISYGFQYAVQASNISSAEDVNEAISVSDPKFVLTNSTQFLILDSIFLYIPFLQNYPMESSE